jgi:hypothetical protein
MRHAVAGSRRTRRVPRMLDPLDCDRIIREHQRAEADAYFQRLYEYFRWRPWETPMVPDATRSVVTETGGELGPGNSHPPEKDRE